MESNLPELLCSASKGLHMVSAVHLRASEELTICCFQGSNARIGIIRWPNTTILADLIP